jgi:hypothetical protein
VLTSFLFYFTGPFNFKSQNEWNVDAILGSRKKRSIEDVSHDLEDENSGNSVPRKSKTKKSRQSN